ncbi:response regulator [Arcobacter sp. LA11]|uniref:response regulator n=1 Tax=Arcobacter sp. LA11 TaxID=1898176 RepID=UPI0009347E9F|nr:response regulator [Arcobacter sp. LA11]
MATVDKKLLKRLKVLYVEDDASVRNELSNLLSNFFENVYTADDGKAGLELYKEKQNDIDVIIADINMPNLTGIEMLEKIRVFDKDVPVIFATAYSDNEFLSGAIKLKVFEYIIKPIDIRKLMTVLADLATILYHDFLLNQQNKELKKYKDILYSNNIVVRTNKNMKISFVNDLFCEITGFDKKELIGKELIVLKHKDTDPKVYKKLYNSVLNNKQFSGQFKNITKDGSYYIANTNTISTLNDAGEVTGCLMIQKDETKEVNKRREVQSSLIKDKGEIFIKSKENTAELQNIITSLKDEVLNAKKQVQNIKVDKDKYIYTAEKYTIENKRLRTELKQYKKDSDYMNDKYSNSKKLSKENADLRIEVKRLNSRLENIKEEHEKVCKQIKVNYEVEIDDLEQELASITEKLDGVENAEAISQKLNYWKEKAKNEAKKIEKLEKKIIEHGDKSMMSKLFGGR